MSSLKLQTISGGSITIQPQDTESHITVSIGSTGDGSLLQTADIGVLTQAYSHNLDGWATKTTPVGGVVGLTDEQTLTNKTISFADNTITTTLEQLNSAVGDADLVSTEGTETLTNKTLTSPTLTNPVLIGSKENRVIVAGSNIDLNAGNWFVKTITNSISLAVTNVPSPGTTASFVLELINGGSATISWWTAIKWTSGIVPSLTVSGRDVISLYTHDGGVTWNGFLLAKDIK